MANAKVSYTAAGGETDFTIPFAFLRSSHISLTINDVASTAFSLPNTTTLRLTTSASPGDSIVISRTTPATVATALIDWTKGTPVTEENMDTSYQQLLYVIQELEDDLADATLAAGNLPTVTGADNNSGLAVNGGDWEVRTPAEIRAHFGIGTAGTKDFGSAVGNVPALEDVGGNPGLPAVDGSQLTGVTASVSPAVRISLNFRTLAIDGAGNWHQNSSNNIEILALQQEFGNSNNDVTIDTGTDEFTLKPGLYKVSIHGILRNTATGTRGSIQHDLVNADTNNRISASTETIRCPQAATTADQVSQRVSLDFYLNVAADTDYAYRMKADSGTSSTVTYENGFISILRLGDNV